MTIKQTLQDWESTLEQQAKEGNEDAIEILNWMKNNRWLKSQRHLPPKPNLMESTDLRRPRRKPVDSLQVFKPKTEV